MQPSSEVAVTSSGPNGVGPDVHDASLETLCEDLQVSLVRAEMQQQHLRQLKESIDALLREFQHINTGPTR